MKSFLELFEMTETGDVQKYDPKMNLQKRKPDGTAHDGNPYFIITDDHVISKLLNGRKKSEHWKHSLHDKDIHDWANKHHLKSFYIKTNNFFIKVR
jgi:hypothetical protein